MFSCLLPSRLPLTISIVGDVIQLAMYALYLLFIPLVCWLVAALILHPVFALSSLAPCSFVRLQLFPCDTMASNQNAAVVTMQMKFLVVYYKRGSSRITRRAAIWRREKSTACLKSITGRDKISGGRMELRPGSAACLLILRRPRPD